MASVSVQAGIAFSPNAYTLADLTGDADFVSYSLGEARNRGVNIGVGDPDRFNYQTVVVQITGGVGFNLGVQLGMPTPLTTAGGRSSSVQMKPEDFLIRWPKNERRAAETTFGNDVLHYIPVTMFEELGI